MRKWISVTASAYLDEYALDVIDIAAMRSICTTTGSLQDENSWNPLKGDNS